MLTRVRAAEHPLGSTRFSLAVARYLYKLMAFKDEYEVARLLTSEAFRKRIADQFEGAWTLVDPEVREQKPLTDVDFSRYKQVQVSGYRDRAMSTDADGALVRDIEIGVINRNTLQERTIRYQERWRYDEAAKRWWLVSGLPDLWQGE